MKPIYNKFQTFWILVITVTLSLINVYGQDGIYVTKSGSPDPNGTIEKPYHSIESGLSQLQTSERKKLIIGPGNYYESLTISTPCLIEASNGEVIIGSDDFKETMEFDLLTLNTHLAGDETFFPSWKDYHRADDIADYFNKSNFRPDIVAFQELWDKDLFYGGNGANGIRPRSGYLYGLHGEEEMPMMNSGLAVMNNLKFTTFQQIEWEDQGGGFESTTAKGYIRVTMRKGKFPICIFNLHTIAGDDDDDIETRSKQLDQLIKAINHFRRNYPSYAIFVLGDLNIKGESNEYYNSLIKKMNKVKGKDADRNSPGFVLDKNYKDQWTSDKSNLLGHWFGYPSNDRIDYIYYISSLDNSIEILPINTKVIPFRGRDYSICVSRIIDPIGAPHCVFPFKYKITNESSDHYAVYSKFKLIRTKSISYENDDENELLVRTVNTQSYIGDNANKNPIRLKGIAKKIHEDYQGQIGLIGMQEAKGDMTWL